jgi:L-2-hydroxycarboxylate dehydrogenase (NAD+)
MSTTQAPMGVLWECRRSGERLPEGCFVDGSGNLTDDPDRAVSAVVFGQHRGFAVSLLVQILTGSLFGFPMGGEVTGTWSTGYTFIALDPSFCSPAGAAAESHTRLVQELRGARATDGGALRLPGQDGRSRAAEALRAGTVDLLEQVLRRLRARAAGDFDSD